jgi:hypothetical protein
MLLRLGNTHCALCGHVLILVPNHACREKSRVFLALFRAKARLPGLLYGNNPENLEAYRHYLETGSGHDCHLRSR